MGPCSTKEKKGYNEDEDDPQSQPKAPQPQKKAQKSKKDVQNNGQIQQQQQSQYQQSETMQSEFQDDPNEKINLIQQAKNKNKINVDFTGTAMVSEKYGNISNDYDLLDPPLGTGAFGQVRKGVHKTTGMVRAVKIIDKKLASADELEKLINEVTIMKSLDHPNIVKVHEYYQDSKFFYIVTEMCTGGELFDRIQDQGCFEEQKACETICVTLQAINYCHKNGIVHRDLKPENLLYDVKDEGGVLKVIDFGTSLTYNGDSDEKLSQVLGTPYYIAPEVLKKNYTEKCDIWSLGVILYILLCGYPPFYGKTDKGIMKKVLKGKYQFEGYEWEIISEDAKDLIRKMLVVNPDERLSAEECLKHPWIKNQGGIKKVDKNLKKKILMNMKGYKTQQKFQEAMYMFFVTFIATRDEKNELLGTFKEIDTNNDGKIDKKELVKAFEEFQSHEESVKTVDSIMDQIDSNHSGEIDYTEFIMATLNRKNMLTPERIEKVFKAFDTDGSGQLSVEEFKEMFGGNKLDDEVWKQIIAEADSDQSGEIDIEEFKQSMMKLIN